MADKIEEIIKEIAARHGIAIGRDDPILMLHTINAQLMRENTEIQQEILDHYKSELEEIAQRWGDDARNKAERTLNAALTVSRDAMLENMQAGGEKAAAIIQREIQTMEMPMRVAKQVAIMNIIAGAMVVCTAVFLAIVFLAIWP